MALKEKKKKIVLEDYEKKFDTFESLRKFVQQQLDSGCWRVRGKRKTTHICPLPADFWQISLEEDGSELLEEIDQTFPAQFSTDYYIHHWRDYQKHRQAVQDLIAWVQTSRARLKRIIPQKERFYEIWKDEKFSPARAAAILRHLELPEDFLFCQAMPDPVQRLFLADPGSLVDTVLITENKDAFCSIRSCMEKGQRVFFGQTLDGVLYGNGRSLYSAVGGLVDTPFFRLTKTRLLYWGDLDWAGIDIFRGFQEKYPMLHIELCKTACLQMLEQAQKQGGWSPCRDDQSKYAPSARNAQSFWNCFSLDEQQQMLEALEKGERIPQEIVTEEMLAGLR